MTKAEIKYFIAKNVKGWLLPREGELLYDLAKETPKNTVIVEIGSWMGKSTCWLLAGSSVGNRNKVYAIDPHNTGDSLAKDSVFLECAEDFPILKDGKIWSYDIFKESIQKSGLWNLVLPLVMTSKEASQIVNEPISLLFIDGAHNYKSVFEDYTLWVPKIMIEGIISFHDYRRGDSAVFRVVNKNIVNNENWEVKGQIDSILYAKKRR